MVEPCIVGSEVGPACPEPAVVLLELKGTCAGDREGWFCERHAREFEARCWRRVDPAQQALFA